MSVLADNTNRRITIQDAVAAKAEEKAKKEPKKRERKAASAPKEKKVKLEAGPESAKVDNPDALVGQPCPVCGKGVIIKGKTAYGCSEWRNGCTYRKNFE